MIRTIKLYPEAGLRQKAIKIEKLDRETMVEIGDLRETLTASRGVGLAATQIGVNKRFLAIRQNRSVDPVVYVNPQIMRTKGEKVYPKWINKEGKEEDFLEGCLSFPGLWGKVRRFLEIEVGWQEIRAGKLVEKQRAMKGFEAVVWAHEYDHLDGILLIDHIREEGGRVFKEDGGKLVEWSLS
jgi:peptide deformylase